MPSIAVCFELEAGSFGLTCHSPRGNPPMGKFALLAGLTLALACCIAASEVEPAALKIPSKEEDCSADAAADAA